MYKWGFKWTIILLREVGNKYDCPVHKILTLGRATKAGVKSWESESYKQQLVICTLFLCLEVSVDRSFTIYIMNVAALLTSRDNGCLTELMSPMWMQNKVTKYKVKSDYYLPCPLSWILLNKKVRFLYVLLLFAPPFHGSVFSFLLISFTHKRLSRYIFPFWQELIQTPSGQDHRKTDLFIYLTNVYPLLSGDKVLH